MSKNVARKTKTNVSGRRKRRTISKKKKNGAAEKTRIISSVSNEPVDGVNFADEVVEMITNAKMALLLALKDGRANNTVISKNKFLARWASCELVENRAGESVKNQLVSMASCGSGTNLQLYNLDSFLDSALEDHNEAKKLLENSPSSFLVRLKNTFDDAKEAGWVTDLSLDHDWKGCGPVSYSGNSPYVFTIREHHVNFNEDGSMSGPVSVFSMSADHNETIDIFYKNGLILFDKKEFQSNATFLILPGNLGGKLRTAARPS